MLAGCLDWAPLQEGRCGDGFLGREESCDDGNRKPGDGCDERCEPEATECGNGRTDPGETCDDKGTADGDGCSRLCQLEPDKILCGNGMLDPDEVCDDGNQSNTDACLNGCSRATCGDGQVRLGVEECDKGDVDEDGCTAACLLCGEPGSHFRSANQHCFTLHADFINLDAARAVCQAQGGDLWTVTSKAEGSDVVSNLGLSGDYWLGFFANPTSESWVTGESAKYQSFAMNEPKTGLDRCVALTAEGELWRSAACDMELPFVCERAATIIWVETNHAYKLHSGALTFEEAKSVCQAEGSALVTLESAGELDFVGAGVSLRIWLDATDAELEGRFVWPDGTEVDPANFRPGQPDDRDSTQNCLTLDTSNRLVDERCSLTLPFACEID